MKFILLLCFLVIIFLIYTLFKNTDKSLIYTLIFSALIIYIILNPKNCINYTISGTKLFFFSVFPSLFPFLVIINLIFAFGGIEIYSRLLGPILCRPMKLPKECGIVLMASTLCGYPLGARYAGELYNMNKIDHKTFERLLSIASNGSPLFIIGTVGTSMLGAASSGYLLILANILSCIVIGLVLSIGQSSEYKKSHRKNIPVALDINFGTALKQALEDAVKSCLSIGSFVVIFSLIINMINSSNIFTSAVYGLCNTLKIPSAIISGPLLGIIEITNGCNIIASSSLGPVLKLCFCSFFIGFSGIAITFQVYSFIHKYHVSMKKYVGIKVLQGIISSFITLLLIQLPFGKNAIAAFSSSNTASLCHINNTYTILLAVLLAPLIISLIYSVFNSHRVP